MTVSAFGAETQAKPSDFEDAKAEIISLDPSSKRSSRNEMKIDYIEQLGVGTPVFPDAESKREKSDGVQKLSEMCELYEGKVIAFAGSLSLIDRCQQRVIEDTQVLNDLIIDGKKQVIDVPSAVVRTIPFGKPFLANRGLKKNPDSNAYKCSRFEGRYVTNDGENFFFVEKCHRRLFVSFEDFTYHNQENRPVLAATPEEFEVLLPGRVMEVRPTNEPEILYKVDGDIYWSRLFPKGKVERSGEDSLKKIETIDMERKKFSGRAELCSRYEGKIVSFYSKLFLIEKCLRRPLVNVSLDVQTSLADDFEPQDLSAEQYRVIPEGIGFDAEKLLKKSKTPSMEK